MPQISSYVVEALRIFYRWLSLQLIPVLALNQEGASEEEINALDKYKFRRTGSNSSSVVKTGAFTGVMSLMGSSDRVTERAIAGEDAVRS